MYHDGKKIIVHEPYIECRILNQTFYKTYFCRPVDDRRRHLCCILNTQLNLNFWK